MTLAAGASEGQLPLPGASAVQLRDGTARHVPVANCTGTAPVIAPSATQICPYTAGMTASGPAGAQGYAWSITNGTITAGAASQTVTFTAGPSGTTTVTLTTTDGGGCTASSSTGITIQTSVPAPSITAGGATTFCPGGSVLLTSSSASGNQWYLDGTPLAGATGSTCSATAGGIYTVAVTAGGCSSYPSAPVTVTMNATPPTPTITAGGPTTFCSDDAVLLTSSSGSGNQWYYNGSPIPGYTSSTIWADGEGNFSVVVTKNGCPSAPSAPVTTTLIYNADPVVIPAGPLYLCGNASMTLTSDSATDNHWYVNNLAIAGATGQTLTTTISGFYQDRVTKGNCNTYSNKVRVYATPYPATPAVVPGGPTSVCVGDRVTLTSSVSGDYWQWYLNGSPFSNYHAVYATTPGNYSVAVSTNFCPSAQSAPLTVTMTPRPQQPSVSVSGATKFCPGGSVTLTSSAASGNQWYKGYYPLAGATQQTLVATAGDFYSVETVTNGCQSWQSSPVSVTVTPALQPLIISPLGPTNLCSNGSVTLVTATDVDHQWFLNGQPISGATQSKIVATLPGNYTVQSLASACSPVMSDPVTITVEQTADVRLTAPSAVAATATVHASATSVTGASYKWTIVNGSIIGSATGASVTFTAGAAGVMTLTASITMPHGCVMTKTADVTVMPPGSIVFDPNGDAAIDPADVFYLVNYLFTQGPPPHGTSGALASGDANGDGVVDAADIFFLVNYLFTGGPHPYWHLAPMGVEPPAGTAAPSARNALDPAVTMLSNPSGTLEATPGHGTLLLRGTTISIDRPARAKDSE